MYDDFVATATLIDGDSVTVTHTPAAGPFGLGPHYITFTASDNGNSDSCSAKMNVVDEESPVAKCKLAPTVQLDNNGKASLLFPPMSMPNQQTTAALTRWYCPRTRSRVMIWATMLRLF